MNFKDIFDLKQIGRLETAHQTTATHVLAFEI
jgi:hypothetical protein